MAEPAFVPKGKFKRRAYVRDMNPDERNEFFLDIYKKVERGYKVTEACGHDEATRIMYYKWLDEQGLSKARVLKEQKKKAKKKASALNRGMKKAISESDSGEKNSPLSLEGEPEELTDDLIERGLVRAFCVALKRCHEAPSWHKALVDLLKVLSPKFFDKGSKFTPRDWIEAHKQFMTEGTEIVTFEETEKNGG